MTISPPQYTSPVPQPERAPQPLSPPASPPHNLPPSSEETQATQNLYSVRASLTPTNIDRIMRDPHSMESRAMLDQIRSTLDPANLSSMLQGANAQANTHVLEDIRHKLAKEQLDPCLSSAKLELAQHRLKQFELQRLDNLRSGDVGDGVMNILFTQNKSLDDLRQKLSNIDSTAKSFTDLSGLLKSDKLNTLRASSNLGSTARRTDMASANTGDAAAKTTGISF